MRAQEPISLYIWCSQKSEPVASTATVEGSATTRPRAFKQAQLPRVAPRPPTARVIEGIRPRMPSITRGILGLMLEAYQGWLGHTRWVA